MMPSSDVVVSSDGIPIRYEVSGTGEPALVFVHGWSCDRTYWRSQVEPFAERYQVVTIDLAGHGESGLGREAWTMPAFGDDVLAVVRRLALGRTVLIGHSMGGDVIVETARHLGARVLGLVWVDTYGTLDRPLSRQELDDFATPFRADFVSTTRDFVRGMFVPDSDPTLVEWIVADMSAAPPEVALDALRHARGNDDAVVDALRDLSAPVVAINPDDGTTDIEGLRHHGVTAVLLPGVGHFLMLEDPEGFNRLLQDAIDVFTGASTA